MLNPTTSKKLINQYVLKKYTDDIYKLVLFNFGIIPQGYETGKTQKRRDVNDGKLETNLSRTKKIIYEYAICNDFDYFVTITLNKEKYDRYNLQKYIKDLGQWIRDQRKKINSDIQYLLIPELHKDGAYHMHGLIKGLSKNELVLFTLKDKLPRNVRKLIKDGRKIYNWPGYAEKFGYCTLEVIKERKYVSRYITKYIKKDVGLAVQEKNKKSYYCSKGLKKAELIKKGTFPSEIRKVLEPNYINDYVSLFDLNGSQAKELIESLSLLEL